jgi:hypothetical protein
MLFQLGNFSKKLLFHRKSLEEKDLEHELKTNPPPKHPSSLITTTLIINILMTLFLSLLF